MTEIAKTSAWMLCQIENGWSRVVAVGDTATELLQKVVEAQTALAGIATANMQSMAAVNSIGEFSFDPDTLTVYSRAIEGYEHKPGNKFITPVLADEKKVHTVYTLFKLTPTLYADFMEVLSSENPASTDHPG